MSAVNRNLSNEQQTAGREATRGTVAGLFTDHEKAQQALEQLKSAGFPDDRIGMATAESENRPHAGFWDKVRGTFGDRDHTRTAEEFRDSLSAQGISADEAGYFDDQLRSGGILVTVRTDDGRANEALRILQQNGADTGSAAGGYLRNETSREGVAEERRIELVGEVLRVHKERVQSGEVRLRKEIVTEQQHLQVPVTREELVIERTPVSGDRTASAEIGSEQEIRVPLTEERVRVEKQPVAREEVRVGKKAVQETREVTEATRREQLKVDKEGEVTENKKRAS